MAPRFLQAWVQDAGRVWTKRATSQCVLRNESAQFAKPAPRCSAVIKHTAGFIRLYILSSGKINLLPPIEPRITKISRQAGLSTLRSLFPPRHELIAVHRAHHGHQRAPPYARVQVEQHALMRGRMPDIRKGQRQRLALHSRATTIPIKNQMEIMLQTSVRLRYQNIMFRTKNTTTTTPAQKIGF